MGREHNLGAEIMLNTKDDHIEVLGNRKGMPAKVTKVNGYKYTELIRQEYAGNNCVFSGGTVDGHPVDTLYVRLEKDGESKTEILLRPDEVAALAWVCSGILWSNLVEKA